MENVETIVKERCYGCRACGGVCKTDAISFRENEEGFLYPQVNPEKCTSCGSCLRVCPAEHPGQGQMPLESYCAVASDEALYEKSASGGIFAAMAEAFLKSGGVVVGAAMGDDVVVRHICIETPEELHKLQGSKYVQSDMGDCIPRISAYLKNGRKVLFCGTSCQVAGLLNAIRRQPRLEEHLYTINLVCHGVPSPRFLREHIRHTYGDVRHVAFRHRTWSEFSKFAIGFEKNGKHRMVVPTNRDVYYSCFSSGVSLRECCYRCAFAQAARVGDITLGDCGSFARYEEKLSCYKSLSMAALHTEKGVELFHSTPGIEKVEMDYQAECACNQPLSRPTRRPKERDTFYKVYFSAEKPEKRDLKPYLFHGTPKAKLKSAICTVTPHRLRKNAKRLLKKRKNQHSGDVR